MPKLEIKRSILNCRFFRIEKPSGSFCPIVSIKSSSAKHIENIIEVIADIVYRNSLKILDLGSKTLDNSI